MKKIAITGHTGRMGRFLTPEFESKGYTVIGMSRATGYNLCNPDGFEKTINTVQDCDIFINLCQPHYQTELLNRVWELWKGNEEKTIINIGTINTCFPPENSNDKEYLKLKQDLNKRHWELINSNPFPKMTLVKSGLREFESDFNDWSKFLVSLVDREYHILEIAFIKL